MIAALLALALADPVFADRHRLGVVSIEAEQPRWEREVPVDIDVDNFTHCDGPPIDCAVPLRWTWEPLPQLDGRSRLDASDLGPGTHRLRWTDGTQTGNAEVVVRVDDTLAGYSSELVGLPFALVPARLDGIHQTDARRATDCVALVVYGARRAGFQVPYMAPRALARFTDEVADGDLRAGDLLDFGFQTAVVLEDLPPMGTLDPTDRIVYAYHAPAAIDPLGAVPFEGAPAVVRRWRKNESARSAD